ncbi:MAG: hypothetical protein C5B51_15865 [Terriglobia bacterium]|nr:MAG: hypothetical protein C5B51_15865 [Terriglobia bacterium]
MARQKVAAAPPSQADTIARTEVTVPAFPCSWEKYFAWIASVLALVFFLVAFAESRGKSPTSDEPPHLAAGLSYVSTGIFRANPEHPPLLKELSGLSLLLGGIRFPRNKETEFLLHGPRPKGGLEPEWEIGNKIISNDPDRVLFWARLPFLLIASLLAVLIYFLGRELVGGPAALCAVLLYICDPTILGHSYLVTTDLGLAAFSVLFLFAVWRYLRHPTTRGLILCGVALGAALCAKFSGVLLLPVLAALLLAALIWPVVSGGHEPKGQGPPRRVMRSAAVFLAMCAIAIVVIEALYFFSKDPFLYAYGLTQVNANHIPDFNAYLAGELQHRFLSYFAAAYLLKEPVVIVVLSLSGLVLLLRNRSITPLQKAFLLAPAAVMFAAATLWAENIGIRYIMLVLPLAHLLGGLALATLLTAGRKWAIWVAGALGAWLLFAAAGAYPDHISYFNESACLLEAPEQTGIDGGSKCGTLWLDDSNVDWGQGLKQLKAWLDHNAPGRTIRYYSAYGFPPQAYGIPTQRIPFEDLMKHPSPGLYVVSASMVARLSAATGIDDWLHSTSPAAVVGHALYVYDIK